MNGHCLSSPCRQPEIPCVRGLSLRPGLRVNAVKSSPAAVFTTVTCSPPRCGHHHSTKLRKLNMAHAERHARQFATAVLEQVAAGRLKLTDRVSRLDSATAGKTVAQLVSGNDLGGCEDSGEDVDAHWRAVAGADRAHPSWRGQVRSSFRISALLMVDIASFLSVGDPSGTRVRGCGRFEIHARPGLPQVSTTGCASARVTV